MDDHNKDPIPPAHLLVVDDEEPIRLLLDHCFRNAGYQVTTAENGQVALAAYEKHRHDAVILDYAMPGMDGVTLALKLRAIHADLPIILLSANRLEETARDLHVYFLLKPASLDTMLDYMAVILSGGQPIGLPGRKGPAPIGA